MAPRAVWRGSIKFADFQCDVGLYTAISSSEKISFNIINRKTGNRVERQYLDSETGDKVERDDQVKGYELDNGDHLIVEGDELAELMPDGNKVIRIKNFIECDEVDKLYFDKPYYLSPSTDEDREALSLLAQTLREKKVAALAEAILFRRNRMVLIRPDGDTIIATTLNYDYEVRSQAAAFKTIPDIEFDDEMLDLAGHIIKKRSGKFDPASYSDRYNDALIELVEAKIAGKTIKKRAPEKRDNVIDLREALRESAGVSDKKTGKSSSSGNAKRKKAS
ncbi:Ku protein [Agrobacterium larrymoorei]|uniref:Non-homologous end joining protein Ku n=1 Tax=Agrobacterium larrymoorei TaxID=160699 RepID=A0AAF0HEN8_9HYPH|nr:Ku protein [Agrobacterium larrymoorei]WHA43170.1 Ku protein [Agrobacterium larrymoorei]